MSYTIWPDGPTGEVLAEVNGERLRQDEKWGEQNHDPCLWGAILMEEVGEAAREALNAVTAPNRDEYVAALKRYRAEMIQVAAVAVAMVESLDRAKWQWTLNISDAQRQAREVTP